jgi:hypothetical protein
MHQDVSHILNGDDSFGITDGITKRLGTMNKGTKGDFLGKLYIHITERGRQTDHGTGSGR